MEEQLFDIGETKGEYIKRMASYAQTTERVIRQAMRIKELEAAGELPIGTTQDIFANVLENQLAMWQLETLVHPMVCRKQEQVDSCLLETMEEVKMKGTRSLNNAEIRKVRDTFDGIYAQRNRGLFMLGVSIGGRVSELLALTIGDVWQNEQAVSDFQFDKTIVKGGETSRTIPMNADGRKAIREIIEWHREYFGSLHPDIPLFPSRKGKTAVKRQAIHKILQAAFVKADLNGKLATHTLRKTFAQRVYQKSDDIFLVKELLGHKNVATTQAYVGINYVSAQVVVEAMSLDAEDNPRDPLDDFEPQQLVAKVIELGYEVKKAAALRTPLPSLSGNGEARQTSESTVVSREANATPAAESTPNGGLK